jgi:hypothetical protein
MGAADASVTTGPGGHPTVGSVSVLRTATLESQPEDVPQPGKSRKVWLIPAVAAVVLVVAVGGWIALRPPPPPEKVAVKILSEPAGAQIAINDVPSGLVTPADIPVDPPPATLPRVTLTSPGYKDKTAALTAEDLKKGSVTVPLEAVPPPPKTAVQPPKPVVENTTSVTIKGDYLFEVVDGSQVISAASMAHLFTVRGRRQLKLRNLDVFLNDTLPIDGSGRAVDWRVPGLGSLRLTAPERCTVWVAGKNVGEPPITIKDIAAGTYSAEALCDGQKKSQTVTINAGESRTVSFTK